MIPLVNLARQYGSLKSEIDAAMQAVCATGAYINGPFVEAFEQAFAAYCGIPHAAGTASGTSALHLALTASGVGPGDEVITTPATFVATIAAITYAGATPVLADVRADAPLLDPDAAERAITPRTRAILPVHLHGHACDMDAINAVAARHGLTVIEDCSQAHGARWNGRRVGSLGHAGAFSLYPAKNFGGVGDGGVVTTEDGALAARIRRLRNWSQTPDLLHDEPAFNARLDAISAAVMSVKLPLLDAWCAARRANAARYLGALAGLGLELPHAPGGSESVWHVFAVRHPRRDALRASLAEAGVQTGVHYAAPIHRHPAYRHLAPPGGLPNAERFFTDTFSLPVCPHLNADEQDHVIASLTAALS